MDVLDDSVGAIERDIVETTTLNPGLQAEAERAVVDTLATKGEKYGVGQGAIVAVSRTARCAPWSAAATMRRASSTARSTQRQPGSAFKPFVYLAALERGLTPDTVRDRRAGRRRKGGRRRTTTAYRGPVTLKEALAFPSTRWRCSSPSKSGRRRWCRRRSGTGINSPLAANPSIALGTSEVTLLELVGAYAPFANGGSAVDALCRPVHPHAERQGVYQPHRLGARARGRACDVAMMNDMLQATRRSAPARKPRSRAGRPPARPEPARISATPGSSATPGFSLVAGVWLGNDDGDPTKRVSGGNLPVEVWNAFMKSRAQGRQQPVALPGGGRFTPASGDGSVVAAIPRGYASLSRGARGWMPTAPQKRNIFQRLFGL